MGVAEILKSRKGKRSWEVLAKELGTTRMTLFNIKHGRTTPNRKLLEKLGLELKLVRAKGQ